MSRKQPVVKFESPLPHDLHTLKPATSAGFRFYNLNSAKTVPTKYITYRPPRVVKTKARWYVEYYFKVPDDLRKVYNKEWERFRVFEDINRYKSDEYADKLCRMVEVALQDGFNPFEQKVMELALAEGDPSGIVGIKEALEHYMEETRGKGLAPETVERYDGICTRFHTWLKDKGLGTIQVGRITQGIVKKYLSENKKDLKWSNRQYNNMKDYLSTVFQFFKTGGIVPVNPVEGIASLKTQTKMHRYYDKVLFPKVNKIIQANQPYLWYMAQFVYYLAVRSNKELQQIKVGDIRDGGENFLFRADVSKNERDAIVPVDPHLREVFKEMGLYEADPNLYIFSIQYAPGPAPVSDDFIAKKFRKIRDLAGLDKEYTLYGYKHTRAVHLLKEGAKLADIMLLFRHQDISTTAKYARELGVDFDASDLHARSRKI